jgi:N-dimethylarginine dimethylaminohydrolase
VAARMARPRRYLMCSPTFFDVTYSINPWMEPNKPIDADLAMTQWERLRELYLELGHEVELIEPVEGLPDMVFSANGATVVDGVVLLAKFRHHERTAEAAAYRKWFAPRGYQTVKEPEFINEGEGDYLVTDRRILGGTGFRTERHSHHEAQALFGRPVISLTLVDPRFYHLDTALAVLDDGEIMYYPAAFSPQSRTVLRGLYPDAIVADDLDAEVFGLNAVSDPNPRVGVRHGCVDDDRCPLTWDDGGYHATIIRVERTPIGWTGYAVSAGCGGWWESACRTRR